MKRLSSQPLSPKDYAIQSNEIEAELRQVRETQRAWLASASGIGRDRTKEFAADIERLKTDMDGLRKRAQRTQRKRIGKTKGVNCHAWD
ncbi:MAG: hypothetical protein ABI577_10660 [bacterium]